MALFCALLFGLCASLPVQSKADAALRTDFAARRTKLLIENGQRHLELGIECRDKGLPTQAAEQIVLAVEESERQNPNASFVLSLMKQYDDKFWKKTAPKPSSARRESYAKKAADVRRENAKAWLELGLWADKRGLDDDAHELFIKLLRKRDEALEFDATGALVLDVAKIPAAAAKRIRDEAIEINSRLYVRDEFLLKVPEIKTLFEATSPRVRVRSTLSVEQAVAMQSLALALLPALADDLGAEPDRRLNVMLLGERKLYDAYLDAAGLGAHKVVSALAENRTLTVVICLGGLTDNALQSLVLHELCHVFHAAVSPSVMPSWYAEGLAETYGAQGTFAWRAGKLELRSLMPHARIEGIFGEGHWFNLKALLSTDALALWASDRERALAFYAESWAWLRFLRTAAGDSIATRFAHWENVCRGMAVGATAGAGDAGSRADADALFKREFGADFEKLETDFTAWLKTL